MSDESEWSFRATPRELQFAIFGFVAGIHAGAVAGAEISKLMTFIAALAFAGLAAFRIIQRG